MGEACVDAIDSRSAALVELRSRCKTSSSPRPATKLVYLVEDSARLIGMLETDRRAFNQAHLAWEAGDIEACS